MKAKLTTIRAIVTSTFITVQTWHTTTTTTSASTGLMHYNQRAIHIQLRGRDQSRVILDLVLMLMLMLSNTANTVR